MLSLGDCTLIIGDIILPSCGHIFRNVKCFQSHDITSLRCRERVPKKLPKCGHELEMKVLDNLLNIYINFLVINYFLLKY